MTDGLSGERPGYPAARSLPITGERTVPGIPHENYWFRRHEAVYEAVTTMISGDRVLEIGCGEGYGTALLAAADRLVIGVDYDAPTVAHASRQYPRPRFVRGNLAALPVATRAVDALVALQVIEHVWDHGQFLAECRRVLRGDGVFVVSTPNRLTFSPGLLRPANLFHTHEFTAAELAGLVGSCGFRVEAHLGLAPGPRLRDLDAAHGGSLAGAQLAAPPDEWSAELAADVAGIAASDFVLADAGTDAAVDLDAALDLVVVARPS